jgi:hypothetical protein
MSLALFQRNETDHEKRSHAANADEDENGDYSDRPFQSGSSFHSFATDERRSNTDYKPACSLFPVGSANKNQFKALPIGRPLQ